MTIASSGLETIADVILDAAARLERPAGFLVLELRRALPRRRDLGLRGLDLGDRFLQRFDLRLEQLDLGLGVVELLGLGDGGVGGRVGRVRLRLGLLRQGGGADEEGAAGEQRANDGGTLHFIPFPPALPSWRG